MRAPKEEPNYRIKDKVCHQCLTKIKAGYGVRVGDYAYCNYDCFSDSSLDLVHRRRR